MPTVDALQEALQRTLGTAEPEAWELKKLGETPLARMARESRSAGAGLPPQFGRLRRGRLVAWDRCSTTWEAWDVEGGFRVLLRCARSDGWGKPLPGHGLPLAEPWPHRASPPYRCTLADLLPLEEPADVPWAAGLVTAVLRDLESVHRQGRSHGQVVPSLVAWEEGWRLLDPGTDEPVPAGADLEALGRLMALVDPTGPIGDLGQSFEEEAPPSVIAAKELFLRALTDHLAEAHVRLVRRKRAVHRVDLVGRLLDLGRRLRLQVPPPPGLGCISAGHAGSFTLLVSDGHTVRGGATASLDLRSLPLLATPDHLDAHANRALMRAWQSRKPALEPLRLQLQANLGSDDLELERILRWLAAAARLRAETVLIASRSR